MGEDEIRSKVKFILVKQGDIINWAREEDTVFNDFSNQQKYRESWYKSICDYLSFLFVAAGRHEIIRTWPSK